MAYIANYKNTNAINLSLQELFVKRSKICSVCPSTFIGCCGSRRCNADPNKNITSDLAKVPANKCPLGKW